MNRKKKYMPKTPVGSPSVENSKIYFCEGKRKIQQDLFPQLLVNFVNWITTPRSNVWGKIKQQCLGECFKQ